MYVVHRSAGVGGIPNKCHQRECIRAYCQVQSAGDFLSPRFVVRRALTPVPLKQKIACALKITVGGSFVENGEHRSVSSVETVRTLDSPYQAPSTV